MYANDGPSQGDDGEWDATSPYPNGSNTTASQYLYNVIVPTTQNQHWVQYTTSTSSGYHSGYPTASQPPYAIPSYGQSGGLPPPPSSSFGRYSSSDPEYYRQTYQYATPSSSTGAHPPTWSTTMPETQQAYHAQHSQYGDGSSPESEGAQSPVSNNTYVQFWFILSMLKESMVLCASVPWL
jgi:hypothetical protein